MRRAATRGKLHNDGEEGHQNSEEWRNIKEALTSIKEVLEKEGVNQRSTNELSSVFARVSYASRQDPTQGITGRLERIETLLKPSIQTGKIAQAEDSSWAKVAARGMRQAGAAGAVQLVRHTVRVQMPQPKGLNTEEILRESKKTISRTAAIRVLHSGDIDVTVPDEAVKVL